MKIPDGLRTLIESGPPAHWITLNREGSPQVTVVWVVRRHRWFTFVSYA